MALTSLQTQIFINKFNNLNTNQQVQMASPAVNYVLRPFEGNINPVYITGIKLYLQATKDIDKETNKLYISV